MTRQGECGGTAQRRMINRSNINVEVIGSGVRPGVYIQACEEMFMVRSIRLERVRPSNARLTAE
jgi:hypothetical protein